MKHVMKLQPAPFMAIKSKQKTIEMRLYDEKRATIHVSDIIEFINIDTKEMLTCTVVNLYCYSSFEELYSHHDKVSIGYSAQDIANPKDMLTYYSQAKINKYGVVGIELQLL
ncbi:MAG: RNA-binding protein [Clostridiales bacterium]|nr:RNA-binding protein [Clostridiales bacterium]